MRSETAEKVREANAHSPTPRAARPGYDAAARSIAAVQQTKLAAAAASGPGEKWTDRSIDRDAHHAGHKR